ncbi:MAG: hypothetical protein J7K53_06190 [Bacteroidales bacterium]|nr:hypothetical protein [Bacteroidales bacterium]
MKKFIIIAFFLGTIIGAKAQKKVDLGIFGGGSYYLGDINQSKQFYSLSYALGGLYRFNINPRYTIRCSIFYGNLQADDQDFNNRFQQSRDNSFSGTVLDATLQFEFNFMPYSTFGRAGEYTVYTTGGIGVAFINISGPSSPLVIPFGVGAKVNLGKKMGIGIEWGLRKMFYDKLDGFENPIDPEYRSFIHNFDWYSIAGISLTYKIYGGSEDCPAYWDEKIKGK